MPIYITPSGWTAVTGVCILAAIGGVGVLAYAAAITSPARADTSATPTSATVASAPAAAPPIARDTPPTTPPVPVRDTRPAKPSTPAAPAQNDAATETLRKMAAIVPSNPNRTPTPPAEPPLARSPLAEPAFRMTGGRYSDRDNIHRAVTHEFGNAYRVADWNDLAPYNDRLMLFFAITGMQTGEENSLWVTMNGSRDWNGRRRYFISRFDGNKPDDYLAHDAKANNTLCLGSFYNRSYRVLAIHK